MDIYLGLFATYPDNVMIMLMVIQYKSKNLGNIIISYQDSNLVLSNSNSTINEYEYEVW